MPERVIENKSSGTGVSPFHEGTEKSSSDITSFEYKESENHEEEIDKLLYQLQVDKEGLDMGDEELSAYLSERLANREIAREFYRKALEAPSSENMLKTTYVGMIKNDYGPLFKTLDLLPEKLDEFTEILIDRQMASMSINQEILYDSLTEERKREIDQRVKDIKAEYDEKISGFLESEEYDVYKAYQDRLSERILVNSFMESLNNDDKLTEDQERILIDSMYQERKALDLESGHDPDRIRFPDEVNEEEVERNMNRLDRIYEKYLDVAGIILDESQIEQFIKDLVQQRETRELSLKMMSQIGGN
jgi:hypothetical protein